MRYLADRARNKQADLKKRKARELELEASAIETVKRTKIEAERQQQSIIENSLEAIKSWSKEMDSGTDELYKQLDDENWKQVRDLDQARLAVLQDQATRTQKENQRYQKERVNEKELKINGFKWL